MVFLVIGAVGLLVLLVSLVGGDLLDGALDALEGDVFSSAVLGAFVAATGFGGAAAEAAGAPLALALPVGLGAGVVFGSFAWWLTRLIRDGGSDATITISDAIGHSGKVVTDIPADGLGVVTVLVGGHPLRLNARATQAIPTGAEIHVTAVVSPTAVEVATVWKQLSD